MAESYLSESPVELALRFADLGGSSTMARTLAEEVRRIRGIVIRDTERQETIAEGLKAGRCACTWYDTGGIHATNCTKVEITDQQVRHALGTVEQMIETLKERNQGAQLPGHLHALEILVTRVKSGTHEAALEYTQMHRAIYNALGFIELADAHAMQELILTKVQNLLTATDRKDIELGRLQADSDRMGRLLGELREAMLVERRVKDEQHSEAMRLRENNSTAARRIRQLEHALTKRESSIDAAIACLQHSTIEVSGRDLIADSLEKVVPTLDPDAAADYYAERGRRAASALQDSFRQTTQEVEGSLATVLNSMLGDGDDDAPEWLTGKDGGVSISAAAEEGAERREHHARMDIEEAAEAARDNEDATKGDHF